MAAHNYPHINVREVVYSASLKEGQKCSVRGWVWQVRDIGKVVFFILRDREGEVQVTLKKGVVKDNLLEIARKLDREDCVVVSGKAVKSPSDKLEIVPDNIVIAAKSEKPLPFETREQIETGADIKLDYRFMDLRDQQVLSHFKVKSKVINAIRNHFHQRGYLEVTTPIIQAAGAEGGATLFEVGYYGRKAFIRQSPQLYKQMLMASGMDNIFEIGPSFRAEKFHTRRHVSEFLMLDMEIAWIENEEGVMGEVEGLIHNVLKETKKTCKAELEALGQELKAPEPPFKRIAYDEAVDMLEKRGVMAEHGSDFGDAEEKILGELMAQKGHDWFFITKYPSAIKPFYIMSDGQASRGIDLSNRGMEIASGGQREHRYKELVARLKEKGLNPEDFTFYISAFRYGMPPHGGIGLGIDRLVQQVTGAANIKDVILFPRTPERLVP